MNDIQTELCIKEHLSRENLMGRETISGLMEKSMKVNGDKVIGMDQVIGHLQTTSYIVAIGGLENLKVLVFILVILQFMRDNLKILSDTGKEWKNLQMETCIEDNTKMGSLLVKVVTTGMMEVILKVIFLMEEGKEKDFGKRE